jgi:N-acyl amino acid synthase FeeM
MKVGAELQPPQNVRGAGLFDRLDYRLIETPEEKDLIYLMRYRAYLHGGLISPSETLRVTDRYDDSPNVWLFGIFVDGELCGSFRLHVLTSEWRDSYTTELFGDILHERLDRGEVFIDPARFTADPEKAGRFPELPYLTVRLAYMACDYFNADTGLAMVRTDHQAFYRRVLLSETISEPRPFPGWDTKRVILMASDFPKVRERILTRFPIMRSNAFERRMLFERASPHKALTRPLLVPAQISPPTAASLA